MVFFHPFIYSATALLSLVSFSKSHIVWTSCGTDLDCGTLQVPLEYGNSTSPKNASIAVIRYNSTVPSAQRLGSLLVNPGGPGASGVNFVAAGAGAAVSVMSGGLYDIIGWDPRGIGQSTPLLQCFANAGDEYGFSSTFPGGPNLWLNSFNNRSYAAQIESAVTTFDGVVGQLSEACIEQNSDALFTSSAGYVARDMAAIVDAIDGVNAPLNYWAFSYGTIFLAEFIQTYPNRVGRIVADGVFDAEANAETYVSQLPNDQVSVRGALDYLAELCSTAGAEGCSLSTAPTGVSANLTTRIDNIFEDLFKNPIDYNGLEISLDILATFLWSFMRVPTTWQLLAGVLQGLELRDATALVSVVSETANIAPTNTSAPGIGTLSTWPLQCVDNAPSSKITIAKIISLTKSISLKQKTPLLSADITPMSFCRNFTDTRPLVANAGVSLMAETNTILKATNKTIIIVNSELDPVTPLQSAQHLRQLLPDSSMIAIREGSGHTTISQVSGGLAEVIYNYFTTGALPAIDAVSHAIDQNIFPTGQSGTSFATPLVLTKSDYTTLQSSLIEAVYDIGAAFLSIA